MMILRKQAVLQRSSTIKHLLLEPEEPQPHGNSLRPSYSKIGSRIHTGSSNPFLKITERTDKTGIMALPTNRSQTEDIEKQITKNKLTLNLLQKANPSFNQLPSRASFNKMKNMLVPPLLYERYSEINKIKGEPDSLLDRLEREFNIRAAKIKVHRNSKKLVRNSRFIIQEPEKAIKSRLSALREPLRQRSSCENIPKQEIVVNKKAHNYLYHLSSSLGRGDWRLKDFYDHIENESDHNEFRIRKLKEREEIIHKLRKINDQCKEMETNSGEIMKSIDVFAKYHDNLSQKLVKKHRKIQKVESSCHY